MTGFGRQRGEWGGLGQEGKQGRRTQDKEDTARRWCGGGKSGGSCWGGVRGGCR